MSETTPNTNKPGRKPQDRKTKDEPTPSEIVDVKLEADALRRELLSDMPALLPPHRFRLRHRNRFNDLVLEAAKSGAFERDVMDFDMSDNDDIEAYQKLAGFIESIDEWAESIAENVPEYVTWSEGKTEDHFLALFTTYQEALGESNSSAD